MTDKMIYFFDLFFNMGRHTPYVWSSVGICILTYLSLYFYHIKTRRSLFHTLIKQQQRAERIALQSKGSPPMNKQRKNRLIIICSIVIGVALTVTLLVYALRQNINLFYTATEIIQGKPDGSKPHVGQRLRIGGMVVINSVQRDPNSLNVTFAIADVGPQVMVQYEGILPDLFQEGKGVVAQGELINANTIKAVEVLAKHDENYVPSEVMEAMKGMENVSIPSNSKQ